MTQVAISGAYLPEDQSDFMDLIFQGEFTEAMTALDANPSLNVNFYTDHPSNTLLGISPLMMSCYFGEVALSIALLKRGAEFDAVCLAGRTALHYAVMGAKSPTPTAREDLIYTLTYLKRDLLTCADAYGNMPIHIGVQKGRVQAVKTLLTLEPNLRHVKNTCHQKTPLEMLSPETDESYQTLKGLLSDRAPSLAFTCATKIAADPALNSVSDQLPSVLQEQVSLFTPMLTKWLGNLTKPMAPIDELSAKLSALKIAIV